MSNGITLFADGVLEATVRHGVARLTLAIQAGDGKPQTTGTLVVPLAQLPALAGSLARLLREVEAKAKENPAASAPASEAAAELPSAFRFQG